jgi:hypothetical protein
MRIIKSFKHLSISSTGGGEDDEGGPGIGDVLNISVKGGLEGT